MSRSRDGRLETSLLLFSFSLRAPVSKAFLIVLVVPLFPKVLFKCWLSSTKVLFSCWLSSKSVEAGTHAHAAHHSFLLEGNLAGAVLADVGFM